MLRQVLLMVGKDCRRRLRSPLPTLLVLAFPLVFAGLIAVTFGGSEARVPKIRLLIEDRDGGLGADLVASAFTRPEAAKYIEAERLEAGDGSGIAGTAGTAGSPAKKPARDGLARLEAEGWTALLRLPAGFTDALLAGRPTTLELVENPSQSILPDAAEQVTGVLAEVLSSASYLLRQPLEAIRPSLSEGGSAPSDLAIAGSATAISRLVRQARPYLFPPAITLETATLDKAGAAGPPAAAPAGGISPTASVFLLVFPGVAVFALFTVGDQAMRDLLTEARKKTLSRQLAGPLGVGTVVAGKALATAAIAGSCLLLLGVVVWALAGRAIPPVHAGGIALLAVALLAAVTGFAALVYGLARSERQGSTVGSLLYLVMAFSGGSFIPLRSLPPALQAVSHLSLFYWGTEGFKSLLQGAGTAEILPHAAVLGGAGALLLVLGTLLLRRQTRRGSAA